MDFDASVDLKTGTFDKYMDYVKRYNIVMCICTRQGGIAMYDIT